MSLWFVTPAFQRFELVQICLEQRRQVIETLAEHGIEAHQVVIADDANLDIARGLGFDTLERDNEWLGRRFNDGKEYAGKHGAEWIVPIGSDSWLDPAYLIPLPANHRLTRTSGMYAPVARDRLAELRIRKIGAGPFVWHRSSLEPVRFRPAQDKINNRVDSSSLAGLRHLPRWEWRDIYPLQYIGFRVEPYITPYDRLWERWGVVERFDPWERLAQHYPADLVARAQKVLER